MADTINIKAILDSSQVDTSLQGLKKSIRELSSIKLDILPKAQADQIRSRIGELINESKDLRESLSTLDSGDFAANTARLLTPLVGGFTAAGAAAELFGVKNKGLNKILQKTQQITIGLMSIQQIADADKLKSTAQYLGLQIKSFFWTGAQTKATAGATIAQKALNVVMSLNPIGLIITALATLVGLLLIFKNRSDDAAIAQRDLNTAMDGTVFSNEDAKDSYNKLIDELKDLQLEYRVLRGEITDAEAETLRLNKSLEDQRQVISDEYMKKLRELWADYNTIWRLPSWLGGMSEEEYEAQYKLITDERTAILKKFDEKAAQDVENDRLRNEKKAEDGRKRIAEQAMNKRKKEYDDYVKSLRDIDTKYLEHLKKISGQIKSTQDILKSFRYEQLSEFDRTQQELIDKADNLVKQLGDNFQEGLEDRVAILNLLDQKLKLLLEKPLINKNEIDKVKKQIKDISKQIEEMSSGGLQFDKLQGKIKNIVNYYNGLVTQNQVQKGLTDWADELLVQLRKVERYAEGVRMYSNISQWVLPTDQSGIQKLLLKNINKWGDLESLFEQYQQEIANINEKYLYGYPNIFGEVFSIDDLISETDALELKYKEVLDLIVYSNEQVYNNGMNLKSWKKLELDILEKQINLTRDYYNTLKEAATITTTKDDGTTETIPDTAKIEELDAELKDKTNELFTNFENRWKGIFQSIKDSIVDVISMTANAVMDISFNQLTTKFELLDHMLQENVDRRQNSLDTQLENNLITQQEYEDESEKLREEAAKAELDLKIKKFRQEKALTMTQIVIDTALGVAKSWGQGGGLFGLPLATMTAIAGALQLAVVAAQNPPTFEKGGLIGGKSHAFGGTILEAEKGEYIINKNIVSKPGMLNYLENINRGGQKATIDEGVIDRIVSKISSIPVINVESNTTRVQRSVRNIETRSKY